MKWYRLQKCSMQQVRSTRIVQMFSFNGRTQELDANKSSQIMQISIRNFSRHPFHTSTRIRMSWQRGHHQRINNAKRVLVTMSTWIRIGITWHASGRQAIRTHLQWVHVRCIRASTAEIEHFATRPKDVAGRLCDFHLIHEFNSFIKSVMDLSVDCFAFLFAKEKRRKKTHQWSDRR